MKYAIIVMSCDRNIGLLDCFFSCFSKFYNGYRGKIYLGLEKLTYRYPGMSIEVVNSTKTSWSGRFKDVIKKVNEQAILLMLDDFMIESPVVEKKIEFLAELICNDDGLAHFALTTVPMKNKSEDINYDMFYERDPYGRYKTTLQCGMWNRNELLDILNEKESAWEVEIFANFRSYISKRKYYALCNKESKPINYNDGFFCVQGCINAQEIERLEKIMGSSIVINGLPIVEDASNRDNIKMIPRIIRRIKIICYSLYYRSRAFVMKWIKH